MRGADPERKNMPEKVYFVKARGEDGDTSLGKKAEILFRRLGLEEEIGKDSLVGLKVHFGEKGNPGYLRPAWMAPLVNRIRKRTERAFLTDTNTLYIGQRSNAAQHLRLAAEHGFTMETLGVPVVIGDGLVGAESLEVPVPGPRVRKAKIAAAFGHTDILLCLSHFTGHVLTGFGAALKNLGMGCASRAGKLEQHSDVHPRVNPDLCRDCGVCLEHCPADALEEKNGHVEIIQEKCIGCGECLAVCSVGAVKMSWDGDNRRVMEKMAEYALAARKALKGKAGFINFLVNITKDCDCMSRTGKVIAGDLGILASLDPVAADQASVDLLLEASGKDFLREANDVDWSVQLQHAERVGLGRRSYSLVELG